MLTLGTALGASADVVTSWNSAALAAIRTNSTPPPVASRALAILHISIYDAVNGISRRHEPYLVESAVQASASEVAAASAAALRVLTTLFPAQTSQFTALHQTIVQAIKDGPQKQAGLTWGGLVADQILASRANDGPTPWCPLQSVRALASGSRRRPRSRRICCRSGDTSHRS